MITRSGTTAGRRREAANGTVKVLERRTEALEAKERLTDVDRLSALRMSKVRNRRVGKSRIFLINNVGRTTTVTMYLAPPRYGPPRPHISKYTVLPDHKLQNI